MDIQTNPFLDLQRSRKVEACPSFPDIAEHALTQLAVAPVLPGRSHEDCYWAAYFKPDRPALFDMQGH